MKDYFKYRFGTDIEFNLDSKDFVSIIGNTNDLFIHTLLNGHSKCNIFVGDKELNSENLPTIKKRLSIVLYKHLNIFVGETVMDEIAFGLEGLAYTKDDIRTLVASEARRYKLEDLLERDCNSLGSSDKTKMKILSALIILSTAALDLFNPARACDLVIFGVTLSSTTLASSPKRRAVSALVLLVLLHISCEIPKVALSCALLKRNSVTRSSFLVRKLTYFLFNLLSFSTVWLLLNLSFSSALTWSL